MSIPRLIASAAVATALTLVASPSAFAQRSGHAAPRGSVRGGTAVRTGGGGVVAGHAVVVAPFRGFYGYRSYAPAVNFSFFYGAPGFFGAYGYGSPFYSYGYPYYYGYPAYGYYPSYGYGYVGANAPYGYGYGGYSGQPYGGLRIDLPQRDAEVYVDGNFVGTVDNFDGRTQQANLEAGPHQIEILSPEFEPIQFSVNIEPGRTITYRGAMRELQP
jgi:hypothetical protein